MVEGSPRSPQELLAQEGYRQAFLSVCKSRGLSEIALEEIKQANYGVVLEAEADDGGAINLPPGVETAIFQPYQGIQAPIGQAQPVLVRSVYFGQDGGIIEIEPKLVPDVGRYEKDEDGFLQAKGANFAVSSEIYIDLVQGRYYLEVIRTDGVLTDPSQDPTTLKEHELTPDMIVGLASLLLKLNNRPNSRVSIYKTHFPT